MATVSSARQDQLALDFLECSSIFLELIAMFEGDGQSRLAATAILRANHMIRSAPALAAQ